jgi:hypothetical protein
MKSLAHTKEFKQASITQASPPRKYVSSSYSLQQVQSRVSSQSFNIQVSKG